MFSAQKIKNNEYKGGTDLDQIMEKVNKISPFEIHVLLLGEDSSMSMRSYEKIKVHGLGYIKDENRIIEALNATDIFLYPTKADNLPLVLLEATACGTPCITFNVGGCGDIIKNEYNGYLIEQGNLDQAAEKLVDLLQNPKKLEEFSSNARKHAKENFSDKLMAERYWGLFEKVSRKKF
jgi:glycosyltransferase involved in cell wall biosynthesis